MRDRRSVTIMRLRTYPPPKDAPHDTGRYLETFPYEGEWLDDSGTRHTRFVCPSWCDPEPTGKVDMAAREVVLSTMPKAPPEPLPTPELPPVPVGELTKRIRAQQAGPPITDVQIAAAVRGQVELDLGLSPSDPTGPFDTKAHYESAPVAPVKKGFKRGARP